MSAHTELLSDRTGLLTVRPCREPSQSESPGKQVPAPGAADPTDPSQAGLDVGFTGLPQPDMQALPSPKQLPGSHLPQKAREAPAAGPAPAADPSSVTIDGQISASWPASFRRQQEQAASGAWGSQAAGSSSAHAAAAQGAPAAAQPPAAQAASSQALLHEHGSGSSPLPEHAAAAQQQQHSARAPGGGLPATADGPQGSSGSQAGQGQPVTASLALDVDAIIESSVGGILPNRAQEGKQAQAAEPGPQPCESPFAAAAHRPGLFLGAQEDDDLVSKYSPAQHQGLRVDVQHAEDVVPRVRGSSPSRSTRWACTAAASLPAHSVCRLCACSTPCRHEAMQLDAPPCMWSGYAVALDELAGRDPF